MKLHFLIQIQKFLTPVTITYNPSLRLLSPLNNFNILPIYNFRLKMNYNRTIPSLLFTYKKQIPIQYFSQTLLTTFSPLTYFS